MPVAQWGYMIHTVSKWQTLRQNKVLGLQDQCAFCLIGSSSERDSRNRKHSSSEVGKHIPLKKSKGALCYSLY